VDEVAPLVLVVGSVSVTEVLVPVRQIALSSADVAL